MILLRTALQAAANSQGSVEEESLQGCQRPLMVRERLGEWSPDNCGGGQAGAVRASDAAERSYKIGTEWCSLNLEIRRALESFARAFSEAWLWAEK